MDMQTDGGGCRQVGAGADRMLPRMFLERLSFVFTDVPVFKSTCLSVGFSVGCHDSGLIGPLSDSDFKENNWLQLKALTFLLPWKLW